MEPETPTASFRAPVLVGGLLALALIVALVALGRVRPLSESEAVTQASQYVERTMPGIHLSGYRVAAARKTSQEPWRVEFVPARPQGRFIIVVRDDRTCELIPPEGEKGESRAPADGGEE